MSTRPYKCHYPDCGKTFKRKFNWEQHERHVHGPPEYQCPIPDCGKTFKWKSGLKYHLEHVHNFDKSLRLSCRFLGCEKSYKSKSGLNAHIRSVHSNTSYKCRYPGCEKKFKQKNHLKRHERTVHSLPKYLCLIPSCDQTFTRKDAFSSHLKYIHNFDESQRLLCPYPWCNQSFKRKGDLNAHIKYTHSDTTRLKCPNPNCDKTYQRKSSLNEHIRLVHKGLQPHVCEHCGDRYKYLADLKNHLKRGLCESSLDKKKIRKEHDDAANELKNFLIETKNPKALQREAVLPNGTKVDLLVRCPNNRLVSFDVTIGRSDANNLRNAILEKFSRCYEQFCDIIYIVAISGIKNAFRTIQQCDRSHLKPKKTRVVHWRTIVQDNPKYFRIFQQIEDKAVL